jgi:serine/threonine protein kinase/WD40 repeat protein
MSSECSDFSNSENEILARLMLELETASDPESIVDRYCADHPELAHDIRILAGLNAQLDQRAETNEQPWMPERLGEFRIRRLIAVGGMGEVYEAEQDSLEGRLVAIKVIRRGRVSPASEARFLREQSVLASLYQTNVPAVHTAGEQDGHKYFVMPYVRGASLNRVLDATFIETNRPGGQARPLESSVGQLVLDTVDAINAGQSTMPWSDAAKPSAKSKRFSLTSGKVRLSLDYLRSVAELMVQAGNAIQHAHEAKVVHRDIKPSNIMVDTDGKCWLIDFGLAGHLQPSPGESQLSEEKHRRFARFPKDLRTSTGLLGTIPYLAPEQWGGQADDRSDVYGLGATLYELCTLRPPFVDIPASESSLIIQRPVRPPKELVANLPADLNAICLKAMSKSPTHRYSSARAFAEDLQHWLRKEPTVARPAYAPRRVAMWSRRNPGWATSIFVLGLAMLITAFAALAESRRARRELLTQSIHQLSQSTHDFGWSIQGRRIVAELKELGTTKELRSTAALILRGLDAVRLHRLQSQADQLVSFPDGNRFLALEKLPGKPAVKLAIVETNKGEIQTLTSPDFSAFGPVTVQENGTPIQFGWRDSDKSSVQVWDLKNNSSIQTLDIPVELASQPTAWSVTKRGAFAAVRFQDEDSRSVIFVWQFNNRASLATIQVPDAAQMSAFSLSPDGTLIAFGMADGRIIVRKVTTGEDVAILRDSHSQIDLIEWGSDYLIRDNSIGPRWLLGAAVAGGDISVWDLNRRTLRSKCRGALHEVHSMAFSSDGTTLISGGRNHPYIWDVASGQALLKLAYFNNINSVAYSADEQQIAVASTPIFGHTGGIDIYQMDRNRGQVLLHGLSSPIAKLKYSTSGKFLAALTHSWQLAIWNSQSQQLQGVFEVPVGIYAESAAIAFDESQEYIAFCSGRQARIWALKNGNLITKIDLPDGFFDNMEFAPDGRLLLFRQESVIPGQPPVGKLSRLTNRACVLRDLHARNPLEPILTKDEFPHLVLALHLTPDLRMAIVEGVLTPAEWLDRNFTHSARRVVECIDLSSGKQIWKIESEYIEGRSPFSKNLIANGKYLHYAESSGKSVLLNMQNGETELILGNGLYGNCVGATANGSNWIYSNIVEDAEKRRSYSVTLHSGLRSDALMTLEAMDDEPASTPFHPSGTQFALGLKNGAVISTEIDVMRAELKKMRLDW